jgi:hypothetical protein
MRSMKPQVLSSASAMVVAATGLLLGVATFAYGADGPQCRDDTCGD